MPDSHYSKEELLSAIQGVAKHLNKSEVSRRDFVIHSNISKHHVLKHFDSWNDFVVSAGLSPQLKRRIGDDLLFSSMRDAFMEAGGITTQQKFKKYNRYGIDAYKRMGGWSTVLMKFRQWLEHNDPNFPYLSDLPVELSSVNHQPPSAAKPESTAKIVTWPSTGKKVYGHFLNFRGLQHAPVNEQGVVFLFGMVAKELGFVVESVAVGFPDCDAKRCVDNNKNLWERVRIEFEFQSRNFLNHGHRTDLCDLIVCWEHNWPECPIEVVELKTEIQKLNP